MKYEKTKTDMSPYVSASEMLKRLVKDVFGTYFIEPDNWRFPDRVTIGRTFFFDRVKKAKAINTTVTENIQYIYQAALRGKSSYDATTVSRRLVKMYRETFQGDYDFLVFFGDESEELLSHKIQEHLWILSEITMFFEGQEHISFSERQSNLELLNKNSFKTIQASCNQGHTQAVLGNWKEKSEHKSNDNFEDTSKYGGDVRESEIYDLSRTASLQIMEISYPFDFESILSYFSARAEDTKDILDIFSYGTRGYVYLLASITGSVDQVFKLSEKTSIFDNAQSILIHAECSPDIPRKSIDDYVMVFWKEHNIKEPIKYDIHHRIDQQNTTCIIKLLCCLPRTQRISYNAHKDALPSRLSFYELLGITNLEELDLANKWKRADSIKSLAAPIGIAENNNIINLDISEIADGPHGLITGMTGSGKSEFLSSYVLSMAMGFHPHDVAFLIVDLKGGWLSGVLSQLPHVLGTLTDFYDLTRFIASIQAELHRRKALFSTCGVSDIYQYTEQFRKRSVATPLPHLVIIVDEFAEIKVNFPYEMKELLSIARIGRGCGIHLILGTHNPVGLVDESIFVTSKFRVCLKLSSEMDSESVIGSSLAYYIENPGRAYLQVGPSKSNLHLFQFGYSGEIIRDQVTQLDDLVQYISYYCKTAGIDKLPDVSLPTLEKDIPYFENEYSKSGIPIGVYDYPQNQEQGVYSIDLGSSNVLILGSEHSGKSNLLQVIIRGCASMLSPEEVNIYVIDSISMGLKVFEQLAVIGGVVSALERSRLDYLKKYIFSQIESRKDVFQNAGATSFSEYKKIGAPTMPHIILLVDNLGALFELHVLDDDWFMYLCQLGLTYGISVIATTPYPCRVNDRYLQCFNSKIALFSKDFKEYRNLFGMNCNGIPDIPGRCIVEFDKCLCECQIYNAFEGGHDIARAQSIEEFILSCNEGSHGMSAHFIPAYQGHKTSISDVESPNTAKMPWE